MTDFSSHNLISAYVDDRLSPEERAEVERLLQSSDEARAELDSYRQLRKALKALPTEQAPADLLSRVMAQAEQESLHGKPLATVAAADEKGSFGKRWTIPALSVVATVGLVLLVMIQFNPPRDNLENAATTNLASNPPEIASNESFDDDADIDRTTVVDEAVSLDAEVRELEQNLTLRDQIQFAQSGNADGTINMLSAYDLRTAEVGDVVDALQVKDDGVVVVQLTVIDRQRFLDAFHVMLNVPPDARKSNNDGERKNDILAVYVEAGEGRFEKLMAQLQQNMDVEQMYVSTTIPAADLNPYVADQGYSDVWALKNQTEQNKNALPQATAAREPLVASNEAEKKEAGRNRSARPGGVKNKEADFDAESKPRKKSPAFRRYVTKSELPPPPPLPGLRELQRGGAESSIAETESAPAESARLTQLKKDVELSDEARQITLRIPESFARKLNRVQPSTAQLSLSNNEAADRQIEKQNVTNRRQPPRRNEEPPPAAGFAGNVPAEKPAAPLPEPAAPQTGAEGTSDGKPLSAKLAAPKPDAVTLKDKFAYKQAAPDQMGKLRPMQVLFVLNDDAVPATRPAQSSPPEAKPAPQK